MIPNIQLFVESFYGASEDLATSIGIIGVISAIFAAIMMGSDRVVFVNYPGLMIVVADSLAVTLIKFPA